MSLTRARSVYYIPQPDQMGGETRTEYMVSRTLPHFGYRIGTRGANVSGQENGYNSSNPFGAIQFSGVSVTTSGVSMSCMGGQTIALQNTNAATALNATHTIDRNFDGSSSGTFLAGAIVGADRRTPPFAGFHPTQRRVYPSLAQRIGTAFYWYLLDDEPHNGGGFNGSRLGFHIGWHATGGFIEAFLDNAGITDEPTVDWTIMVRRVHLFYASLPIHDIPPYTVANEITAAGCKTLDVDTVLAVGYGGTATLTPANYPDP